MKILLAVHHFPPRYWGGGELRAYETARWLEQHGHRVRVLCIESITAPTRSTDGSPTRLYRFQDEIFEGIPVRRLFLNLAATPDPFRYAYDNPLVGAQVRELIATEAPDVLHLIGGYLITASALDAARAAGVPTVVTLLEFWFLCAVNILLRGDGSLCEGPFDLVDCARCVMDEKRRYRLPDTLFPRLSRRFWHLVAESARARQALGLDKRLAQLNARREKLLHALAECDAIISPSRFIVDIFAANGVPRQKIQVIEHLENAPPIQTYWEKTPSSHLRFGYLGQITKMKGVDVLVEAFLRLRPQGALPTCHRTPRVGMGIWCDGASPTCHRTPRVGMGIWCDGASPQLILYGNPDAFPRFGRALQARARANPNIIFAGTYEREQVYRVLQGIDVLVFPSIWYENAPRVIREAFATGTPVVASNLGSAAEYVKHEVNGLLFARGDAKDLARQMQRFVDDPGLVARLRQGIPRVKSLDAEMQELLQVYERVVTRNITR